MIHISSNDISSGYIYKGIWNLNQEIRGRFSLKAQYMSTGTIAWMYDGNANILWMINGESITLLLFLVSDNDNLPSAVYSDDATTQLNFLTSSMISGGMPVSGGSYDSASNSFTITFSQNVDLFWSGSGSRWVFNKFSDEINVSSTIIPRTFMTVDPKWLECYISEAVSEYSDSRSTVPTLLISTKNTELTGQEISIRNNTSELNILFKRTNFPTYEVPFTMEWDLIFTKV